MAWNTVISIAIWLLVGLVAGAVATRIYYARALGFVRARQADFEAWFKKEIEGVERRM
jgi:hypothetical protein